jgi:multiple sugar transport system permease protein
MSKNKRYLKTVLYHSFTILLGLFMLYPVIWMFASSFKENSEIFVNSQSLIPRHFTIDNYITGWKGFGGTSFSTFFKNSFFVTILSTFGSVSASTLVAYGFSRIRFKGKKLWFTCMMLTMMLPGQVVIIPQYIIFSKIHWVNTFLPLIVPSFFGSAFFIFLIMQFIRGIPSELDESAKIDGCGKYLIFFRIILPLLTPAIITSTIFSFYWSWDDFFGPLIYLNSPVKYTVSYALALFADPNSTTNWGAMFAISSISIVPVVAMFIAFQKYLVEGISTTGLKS